MAASTSASIFPELLEDSVPNPTHAEQQAAPSASSYAWYFGERDAATLRPD
jgi:hypothetical protein